MYYQNESDETLVLLTLAGEQAAYEVLVTRHQRSAIFSAITVTKNYFMAEDAAQDAFVTAWMKLNTLQEPQKYGSWVRRIAKNCALNMISRYRSFLPLDVVDNLEMTDDSENPAELYMASEERNEVRESIESLPKKVRQIILLHYFEGLPIAKIADRMRISEGTVKRQLHDGRKQIRKELCAMNEKYSDTLVQRVMKKVEELKMWQLKKDKSGFEKVYSQVLHDVEELPECTEKHHALADVLTCGWWWLPGKKNDALFARIAEAAIEGKNEEVMSFIVAREDSEVYGGARIDFIREKQIPRLEAAGFTKALGREWFWLGYHLCHIGKGEEGRVAYEKATSILERGDPYRILVPYALRMEQILATEYKGKSENRYQIGATAEEYRWVDGVPCAWSSEGFEKGYLSSIDRAVRHIFRGSSRCDGKFFADISLGESFLGSDGTTLTYASDSESVETPCGLFEKCQLWVTTLWDEDGKSTFKSYYKEGVGIVKHVHTNGGISEAYLLKSYRVKENRALLPLAEGNLWEYAPEQASAIIHSELIFTVSFADGEKAVISSWNAVLRTGYNEDSWLEMVGQIRCDYCDEKNGREFLCDVLPAIARAEQLAVTPMERAHTKAAASVARRILSTDTTFNPDYHATGHWNFFSKNAVQRKKDSLYFSHSSRWSFEWKVTGGMGAAEEPILFNDILGILQDATNCIWSNEWCIGATPIIEYTKWSRDVRTQITCEDGGTIATKAGTFENCFKLCLNIEGMADGWSYRGGRKVYYFAEGIGIVRTENEFCGGAKTAVYELTSFEGVGEGYMPLADGLVRRYDAIDLTDGFVAAAEYTYVADEDGEIVIFADRTGIRELPPPITQYSAIQGEIFVEELWDAGKWQEAQMRSGVNNFHLILHLLARPGYNRNNAKRSVAINGFHLNLISLLSENGEVPPGWYGVYGWRAVVRAAGLFGDGQKEEGYKALELALQYCERVALLKEGDLLEIGNPHLFGGAKLIWGKGLLRLPDGSLEPINYTWELLFSAKNLYYAITAPRGWEWFNSVRTEDRFKAYVERVRKMTCK